MGVLIDNYLSTQKLLNYLLDNEILCENNVFISALY